MDGEVQSEWCPGRVSELRTSIANPDVSALALINKIYQVPRLHRVEVQSPILKPSE